MRPWRTNYVRTASVCVEAELYYSCESAAAEENSSTTLCSFTGPTVMRPSPAITHSGASDALNPTEIESVCVWGPSCITAVRVLQLKKTAAPHRVVSLDPLL